MKTALQYVSLLRVDRLGAVHELFDSHGYVVVGMESDCVYAVNEDGDESPINTVEVRATLTIGQSFALVRSIFRQIGEHVRTALQSLPITVRYRYGLRFLWYRQSHPNRTITLRTMELIDGALDIALRYYWRILLKSRH
jgi:hypothetical protein